MSEDPIRDATAALERAEGFLPRSDPRSFSIDATPFDVTVRVTDSAEIVGYTVTVRVPTLDDVVEETVDPVITDGWLDTFELRMEDLDGATRSDVEPPTVALDADREQVVVETSFETGTPTHGVADTRAIVQYIEGTYMEGVIPGFSYRDPVVGMLQQASQNSRLDGDADVDIGPGGTPL